MTNPMNNNNADPAPAYVQLTLGKTRLLFPGTEVLSLGAIPEMGASTTDGSVGVVMVNEAALPVYSFDEQLQPAGGDKGRSACACFGKGGTAFGLLCDKLEIVDGVSLQVVALPACMRSENTPIQSLALQGTRVLCVSNVDRFAGMLDFVRKGGAKP